MNSKIGPGSGPITFGRIMAGAIRALRAASVLCFVLPASAQDLASAVPDSAALEAQHATLGEIRVVNGDVFATETPEENHWFYRLANRLHIETRPNVIRQQLLFKSGEPYSDRLLRESERILRGNRYLFDADIVPVAFHDGVVDVEVRTRDVWTFKPGINFGRTGGSNTSGFELQESNLLGFGKEVTVARRETVDRTSNEYRYFDPHVLGSWTRFAGSYAINSDGRRRAATIDRPFYSLDTQWAAGAGALDWDRTDQRYNLGVVVDEFRHEQEVLEARGGWSAGRHNDWVRRVNFGVRYELDEFAPTNSLFSAAVLPQDRKLAYPFIGLTLFNDQYEERRNEDQIERTEDRYTGTFVQASVGIAQSEWGSDRDAWIWRATGGSAFESALRVHTLRLSIGASGRIEDGESRNVIGDAEGRYYWRVTERQLFFASLRGTAVEQLDAEKQLLLGGDTGLRGYPLRFQDGTSQALLTLEHRVFTKYYLFRLFHVGGAVFFDAGRSWGRGNAPPLATSEPTNQGLLTDAGFGLRFGSSRSAFGNVIHVDLAFPFNGPNTINRMQFIVESKTSF
ncbi:MAG TPA: hypothetical protein VK629_11515 [Steroidobacteraceae bacterium]|nr:hypothetical protein [Steroidobacteraceae bacterium]